MSEILNKESEEKEGSRGRSRAKNKKQKQPKSFMGKAFKQTKKDC